MISNDIACVHVNQVVIIFEKSIIAPPNENNQALQTSVPPSQMNLNPKSDFVGQFNVSLPEAFGNGRVLKAVVADRLDSTLLPNINSKTPNPLGSYI